MGREDDALARRLAREARRAAMRARDGHEDEEEAGMTDDGAEAGAGVDPVRAAREAARAAAMGAAAGAMRALTARRGDDQPPEADDGAADDLEAETEQEGDPGPAEQAAPRRREARPQPTAAGDVQRAVEAAKSQLQTLHGADAEGVSAFERTADGYRITLEVVELRRIPETTDVLASYAVEVDGDGDLLSYERVRRYQRSEAVDRSSP